jgi:hypothetical protein
MVGGILLAPVGAAAVCSSRPNRSAACKANAPGGLVSTHRNNQTLARARSRTAVHVQAVSSPPRVSPPSVSLLPTVEDRPGDPRAVLGPLEAPSMACGRRTGSIPYFGDSETNPVLINDVARDAVAALGARDFIALPTADDPALLHLRGAMERGWRKVRAVSSSFKGVSPHSSNHRVILSPR